MKAIYIYIYIYIYLKLLLDKLLVLNRQGVIFCIIFGLSLILNGEVLSKCGRHRLTLVPHFLIHQSNMGSCLADP